MNAVILSWSLLKKGGWKMWMMCQYSLAQMEIPSPVKMGGGCVYSSLICVCDVRKQLRVLGQ